MKQHIMWLQLEFRMLLPHRNDVSGFARPSRGITGTGHGRHGHWAVSRNPCLNGNVVMKHVGVMKNVGVMKLVVS